MSMDAAGWRVGIVGLGLMGGSVARSLKARNTGHRVTAFTRESGDAEAALDTGVVDVVAATASDAVRDQELVIYATPLRATIELMGTQQASWGDAAVTDVVGLKEPLLDLARKQGFSHVYVGAHPMVGGTGSGFGASVEDLFVDRTVWVVQGEAEVRCVNLVEDFWRSLGALTKRISATDHDELMAWVSHLPQLLATALAKTMAAEGLEVTDLGPGGLDMTRLAGSSTEMWSDLFDGLHVHDEKALAAVERQMGVLRAALRAGDVDAVGALMDQARRWRTGA